MKLFGAVAMAVMVGFLPTIGAAHSSDTGHPDNLAATHQLGCLAIDELSSTYTPADYKAALVACANEDRLEDAARVFVFMNMYAAFDSMKLTDRTSFQGLTVLILDAYKEMPEGMGEKIQEFTGNAVQTKSDFFKALCTKAAEMGPPRYDPVYLAAHGIEAFETIDGHLEPKSRADLIAGFREVDTDVTWMITMQPCDPVLK